MKRFHCQFCKTEVHFENTTCVKCKRRLGYLSDSFEMNALEPSGDNWIALAQPNQLFQLCENARHNACNWMIDADATEKFCAACEHNRTIPDLSVVSNLANWRKMELAKHYLFYSLLRWKLPLPLAKQGKTTGLEFDFIANVANADGTLSPAMTGHDNGVITISLAEADDAIRERRRTAMGEPYRTLLGHFRHEIGHYYWDLLVRESGRLERCRQVFGDDRQNYEEALKRHYQQGPPPRWAETFISSYASSHPWEDFAETWSHYIHMVDSLETARAYGISLLPEAGSDTEAAVQFEPYSAASASAIVNVWIPFTVAFNSLNRSMGQRDFYPFVLNSAVLQKLQFIHELVLSQKQSTE